MLSGSAKKPILDLIPGIGHLILNATLSNLQLTVRLEEYRKKFEFGPGWNVPLGPGVTCH